MFQCKILPIALCLVLVLCVLCGCQEKSINVNREKSNSSKQEDGQHDSDTTTEGQPDVTEPALDVDGILLSALKGEIPVITVHNGEMSLPDYISDQIGCYIHHYAYVDFDHDGQNELVLSTDSLSAANIVLHYENGIVSAFEFDFYNDLGNLTENGHFMKNFNTYQGLSFRDSRCSFVTVASKDDSGSYYEVDGNACDQDTFDAKIQELTAETSADWILADFSPDVVYTMYMTFQSAPFELHMVFSESGYFCATSSIFSTETYSYIKNNYYGTYSKNGNDLYLEFQFDQATPYVSYSYNAPFGSGKLTIIDGGIFTSDVRGNIYSFQLNRTVEATDIIESCASEYDISAFYA